ncbi:MAG: type II toxin-antitoxin system VapC family toxin [Haliangium ochraceum]
MLVRYLTQDDAVQARKANAVIDRALAGGERLHIDTVVLCELVWVLRSAYDCDRSTVADIVGKLLDAGQLSVDDRDQLREATRRYAHGGGDLADHVLALRNRTAGCDTTLTFDRAHRKSDLFSIL